VVSKGASLQDPDERWRHGDGDRRGVRSRLLSTAPPRERSSCLQTVLGVVFRPPCGRGSSFTSPTIVDSNLSGAKTLCWYNGSTWVKISRQIYSSGPPPTITVQMSSTSTLTIAQLPDDVHGRVPEALACSCAGSVRQAPR
jgi:hypothetical protein